MSRQQTAPSNDAQAHRDWSQDGTTSHRRHQGCGRDEVADFAEETSAPPLLAPALIKAPRRALRVSSDTLPRNSRS